LRFFVTVRWPRCPAKSATVADESRLRIGRHRHRRHVERDPGATTRADRCGAAISIGGEFMIRPFVLPADGCSMPEFRTA